MSAGQFVDLFRCSLAALELSTCSTNFSRSIPLPCNAFNSAATGRRCEGRRNHTDNDEHVGPCAVVSRSVVSCIPCRPRPTRAPRHHVAAYRNYRRERAARSNIAFF